MKLMMGNSFSFSWSCFPSSADDDEDNFPIFPDRIDSKFLVECSHEHFLTLLATSEECRELATGVSKNMVYQSRVEEHFPQFISLVGIFPQDKKNKWKELYDSLVTMTDNPFMPYLNTNFEESIFYDMKLHDSLASQLTDENFYQFLALNHLAAKRKKKLIEEVLDNPQLQSLIFRNGAFRLLKWIDSIGLLSKAMDIDEGFGYPVHLVIGSGNLELLKWLVLEKAYPLMNSELEAMENGINEVANMAVGYGHFHMLDWLKEQGHRPDQEGELYLIDEADAAYDKLTRARIEATLDWLEKDGMDIRASRGYFGHQWLYNNEWPRNQPELIIPSPTHLEPMKLASMGVVPKK